MYTPTMHPYANCPNVIAPYLNPVLQVNNWNSNNPYNFPQHFALTAPTLPSPFIQLTPEYNSLSPPVNLPPPTYQCQFVQYGPTSQMPNVPAYAYPNQFQDHGSPNPPAPGTMPQVSHQNSTFPATHQSSPNAVQHGSSNSQFQENMMDTTNNTTKIIDVENLLDANLAGNLQSLDCKLILTEGKAAMSLAVAGLSVTGRDKYGLYAMNRRLINVCKTPADEVKKNSEVRDIMKILGLRFEFNYDTEEELSTLRYGKVILMFGRDEDGSHMKGLIINFFYKFWPSLLRMNRFLMQFILPVVRVCHSFCIRQKHACCMKFYTLEEYEEWKSKTGSSHADFFATRYYKSLESFTSEEMKECFANLSMSCEHFQYFDYEDDEALVLAFEKDHEDSRRKWISKTLRESFSYRENLCEIRFKDFVNKELLFYCDLQNFRSFPSAMDGLTRSQRKVLHACFKRYPDQEVGVLKLMGSVFEISAYKQSMDALGQTIINMAQNYVGKNNINILMPIGQFGTRIHGGKDAGKAKYLHTKLNSIVKDIFSELDFPILEYRKEDDWLIEPFYYLPIIPMILINGSDGIGTGWKTRIPTYNPKDIINNLFRMLDDLEPVEMVPWFKDFKGSIESITESQICSYGEFSVLENNEIEITELPIGVWTETYKEKVLNPMIRENVILYYKEYHTDTTVNFLIKHRILNVANIPREDLYKKFHLKTNVEKFYFVAIDKDSCVRDYGNPLEILKEYFQIREINYGKRQRYLVDHLEHKLKASEDIYKKILYNDGSSNYEYPGEKYTFMYDVSRIQEENFKKLEKDIKETRQCIEQLRNQTPRDLWRSDLEKLLSKLENILPEQREDNDKILNSLRLENLHISSH